MALTKPIVRIASLLVVSLVFATSGSAQGLGPGQVLLPNGAVYTKPKPAAVERLGPNKLRIGNIQIDTAAREVSVSGHVNDVVTAEWVANTEGGFKAYESAISADTDAIAYNTALLLIGLDKAHARVPVQHFDPVPPRGDPVEVWVEWGDGAARKRVPIEELLFDQRSKKTLPVGPWVYTGSQFVEGNAFQAQLDGVLIGFVHSPAPVIENPGTGAVNAYGSVIVNKNLIQPGTRVNLIVKAVSTQAPK